MWETGKNTRDVEEDHKFLFEKGRVQDWETIKFGSTWFVNKHTHCVFMVNKHSQVSQGECGNQNIILIYINML